MTKIILFLVFLLVLKGTIIFCTYLMVWHYQFHAGGWGTSPNGEQSVVSNSTLLDRGCGQVIVNNNYPAASVGPQGERGPPGPAG